MRNLISRLPLVIGLLSSVCLSAYADCFDECMSIKDCWHKGQMDSSYCGTAEVNCDQKCRREEERANRRSYGAIAYSRKDGSYGYSAGQDSQSVAEDVAMNYCKQYSDHCRNVVWYYNSCGAVAAKGRKVGWGTGDSADEAADRAYKKCGKKDCEVKVAQCSF